MAFTETARVSGTVTRSTIQTATNNFTLSAAPASGQWVVVAIYSDRGAIAPNVVQCGTNVLGLIQVGSTNVPYIYGSEYESTMTTTIAVNWTNSVASTVLGVVALAFSGGGYTTGVGAGSNCDFRLSTPTGAFDGGGTNTFGSGGATTSTGIATWTNSNNAIQTNYDAQRQPFICALWNTSAVNIALTRQNNSLFPAVVDSSGNVTTAFGTTGNVQLNSSTTGLQTTNGAVVFLTPSGNFVVNYTSLSGTNLVGCTTSAPSGTVIPAYCQMLGHPNATNTVAIVLASASRTSGTLNGFQTGNATYSGASTQNGYVQLNVTGSVSGRLTLMGGASTNDALKQSAYAVLNVGGSITPTGGGAIYTLIPTTRTMTRLGVVSRTLIARAVKVRTYARNALSSQTRIGRAVRTVASLKSSVANALRIPLLTKTRALQRVSAASQVNVASVTKTRQFVRATNVSVTYTIASSRSRTYARRAIATAVATARVAQQVFFRPRAGTVTGDFKIAGGRAAFQTAQLEGTFDTANVVGSQKKTGQI